MVMTSIEKEPCVSGCTSKRWNDDIRRPVLPALTLFAVTSIRTLDLIYARE